MDVLEVGMKGQVQPIQRLTAHNIQYIAFTFLTHKINNNENMALFSTQTQCDMVKSNPSITLSAHDFFYKLA